MEVCRKSGGGGHKYVVAVHSPALTQAYPFPVLYPVCGRPSDTFILSVIWWSQL